MNQNPKSATTAGLLGIFLGGFGAHNWYLGEKTKGIIHVCMMCGGVVVEILASIILPNVLSFSALLTMAWLFSILTAVAGLAMSASAIWGLVEGIQILVGGDAGLAAKGYPVANPQMAAPQYNNYGPQYGPAQGYQGYNQPQGQPMGQPMPGYNQPQQPMPGYGQPMNQPMPGQPMNQPAPESNPETLNEQ